jgi:hypothetical protein
MERRGGATMVLAGSSDLSASEIDTGQTFWENTATVIASDDWAVGSDNEKPPILEARPHTSTACQARLPARVSRTVGRGFRPHPRVYINPTTPTTSAAFSG